ncbi:hypothetical protein GCM10007350_31090 [Jeongeupia chitinilytica]|uniref:Uncharacterized protein n=1 Tax=Jeongeupia chitinilytica TaxID=1041641 RepID=A0ABQ3H4U7_9NEIS|nr:hypothetical protein GCM10007350_31090 [Jeongeupia chitinilytica]
MVVAIINVALQLCTWLDSYPSRNEFIKLQARALIGHVVKIYPGSFTPDLIAKRLALNYVLVDHDYYRAHKEKFITLLPGIEYEDILPTK